MSTFGLTTDALPTNRLPTKMLEVALDLILSLKGHTTTFVLLFISANPKPTFTQL